MTNNTSKYQTYILHGLPAGMFGEAYILITGTEISQGEFRGEYFIFTQRPVEALLKGQVDIFSNGFPEGLGEVNIEFIMSEALRQAEIEVLTLVENRATELERPDLGYLPFELREYPSPFVGCKMRGRFIKQLMDVKDSTQNPSLALHLKLLQQVNVVR